MANKETDAKKVPVFLSVFGSKTLSVLRTLVAPIIPRDKFFVNLVSVLKKQFDPGKQQQGIRYITVGKEDPEQEVHSQSAPDPEDKSLYAVEGSTAPPYQVSLLINNVSDTMEFDTKASITLISEAECHQLFPKAVLLRTYLGERIHVVEEIDICVQYKYKVLDSVQLLYKK